MREPINISIPYRYATAEEVEAFNDIERKVTKPRQPTKEAEFIAEIAILAEKVKVLSARVTELENKV
jgi:hypothetical protein